MLGGGSRHVWQGPRSRSIFMSVIRAAVRREMVGHQKMSDGVDQDEAYIKVTALCLKRNIHKYSKSS